MQMQPIQPDPSLVTSILDQRHENSPRPSIGMGATILGWTDRYAGTVIEVSQDRITIQEDHSTRTDKNGDSSDQVYVYSKNDKGLLHHFGRRGGSWVHVIHKESSGTWQRKEGGYDLLLGKRDHFFDFSY